MNTIQNILLITLALNAAATLVIGAVVYIVDRKKIQNSIWMVYNVLFCLWNFCIYEALRSPDKEAAIYWLRVSVAAIIFLVPVFLHFLSAYSDKKVFQKRILGGIYLLFFMFFILFFAMPNEFISGVREGLYMQSLIVPGTAFHIFVFIFFGFLMTGFYYLLRSSKLYVSFLKNQRQWLFLGTFLAMWAPLSFLITVYWPDFFPFGIFLVLPYLAITSFAIIRHHLPEIDIVINKTVILSYFTLFVLLMYVIVLHILYRVVGVEYFMASIISGCIVLLHLLLTVHYSKVMRLDTIANNIVYEKRLSYYKLLENLNSIASKTTNLGYLANNSLELLTAAVNTETVTLYLYDEADSEYRMVARKGPGSQKTQSSSSTAISEKNAFIEFLREGNVYVREERDDFAYYYNINEIKNAFDKINTDLSATLHYSFPLYGRGGMIGFLNLGNKKGDSSYSTEDVDMLNAFRRQLSICIDNAKLYLRAVEDDLTKLYRINYFNKRLQEEIERAERYVRPFSIILVDVDNFKQINDTYGHQAGDESLRKIAQIIKLSIRRVDIAARYGGEEFSILMPETPKANAYVLAERLRNGVEKEFSKDNKGLKITISIGVSGYRPGSKAYEVIKEADDALYKAKRQGKNKVF